MKNLELPTLYGLPLGRVRGQTLKFCFEKGITVDEKMTVGLILGAAGYILLKKALWTQSNRNKESIDINEANRALVLINKCNCTKIIGTNCTKFNRSNCTKLFINEINEVTGHKSH